FHGQVQKRLDPLDSEHLGAQLREQGCLVSRSRADLQNTLGTFQLQQLQVSGMNGRLRDGLLAADWERGVLVGTVPHARWYEQVSRYGLEGFEHALIVDPVPAQSLDKAPAGCHIPGFYRECHQSADAASTSRLVRSRCNGVIDTYPSSTARKSESASPVHEAEPPPIQ